MNAIATASSGSIVRPAFWVRSIGHAFPDMHSTHTHTQRAREHNALKIIRFKSIKTLPNKNVEISGNENSMQNRNRKIYRKMLQVPCKVVATAGWQGRQRRSVSFAGCPAARVWPARHLMSGLCDYRQSLYFYIFFFCSCWRCPFLCESAHDLHVQQEAGLLLQSTISIQVSHFHSWLTCDWCFHFAVTACRPTENGSQRQVQLA